jgi:hypothetical protein
MMNESEIPTEYHSQISDEYYSEIPAEHYNGLTSNQDEDLHHLLRSVDEAIYLLAELKKQILTGKLSQREAELWHNDLINNEGLDFLSALEQYAWSDTVKEIGNV